MRRPVKNRQMAKPDKKFNSLKVGMFINYVMLDGKKDTARKAVYDSFKVIEEKEKADALQVFEEAIRNVSPAVEVRSRRVGGANYQVPREVRQERQLALALRWILDAARGRKGVPISVAIADELVLASKKEGAAYKKKEDTLKQAEANRAFAHFAW